MKRSDKIFLAVMGASAAGLAFHAATRDAGAAGFTDINQCVTAAHSQATCRRAFDDALRLHLARAPRFSSSTACQAATDTTCVAALPTDGRPARELQYAPAFSAFTVRERDCRNDENRNCGSSGSGSGGGGGSSGLGRTLARSGDPLYEARSQPGSYRDMGGFGSGAGGKAGPPTVRTATVSRGGFGFFHGLRVGG